MLFDIREHQSTSTDSREQKDPETGSVVQDNSDYLHQDGASSSVQHEGESAGDDGTDGGDGGLNTGEEDASTDGKAMVTTTLSAILHPGLVEHEPYIIELLEAAHGA